MHNLLILPVQFSMMAKQASISRRAFVEGVGTFLFTFIGAGAVIAANFAGLGGASLLLIAIANGIGLALAVSFAMNISGGHMNPAVTIAMLANGYIKIKDAAAYILYQIMGALLAGVLLLMVYPYGAGWLVHFGAPSLSHSISPIQGILFEGLMTFILVFIVMGTVVDKRAPKIAGLGVGLAVMVDVLAGGPFTGAAMNPARALGPEIVSAFFANWYVYWIGPILGALLAALIYKHVIMEK